MAAITLHIPGTLLKKNEVAEILACSPREIDRRRHEWGLRHIYLTSDPKSLRFVAEDVQRFIESKLDESKVSAQIDI